MNLAVLRPIREGRINALSTLSGLGSVPVSESVPEVSLASLDKNDAVAFSRPGGEVCDQAGERPIDLAHLAQQTMGDRDLERDVLDLFVEQALQARDRLAQAGAAERRSIAHSLKGSARSVGAAAIARCAEAIEDHPDDRDVEARLAGLIDEVRDFIAAISR